MSLTADPVPLRLEENGTYRVGESRVTLDVLMHSHLAGASPEEIVESFPTLKLADVYGAISYYLNHREEIDSYLDRRQAEAADLRRRLEDEGITPRDTSALRQKLLARWKLLEQPKQGAPANGAAAGG